MVRSSIISRFINFSHTQRHFSSGSGDIDKVTQVQGQVDELKGIMVRNIDNIAARGERLELLVDKTEDLSNNVRASEFFWDFCFSISHYVTQSVTFKKSSRNLARHMWWKNIKLTVIIIIVVIVSAISTIYIFL